MPILPVQKCHDGFLYIWHLTESLEELEKKSLRHNLRKSLIYKHKQQRKQFLAKQILLKQHHYFEQLSYLPSGKPVLNSGQHISITHSKNYLAIMVLSQKVGIDLEQNQEKLAKVAGKFVNESDFILNTSKENPYLWLWTAKESIYKLIGEKGLSLKKDIVVQHIDPYHFTGQAQVKSNKINLYYKKIRPEIILCTALFRQ